MVNRAAAALVDYGHRPQREAGLKRWVNVEGAVAWIMSMLLPAVGPFDVALATPARQACTRLVLAVHSAAVVVAVHASQLSLPVALSSRCSPTGHTSERTDTWKYVSTQE
jgi:hypothetical protein